MKGPEQFQAIYLYAGRVDFRKAIDGLSILVESEMEKNVFEKNSVFIFVNRNRSRMKCLYWDQTGFALWMKRLEKSKFPWLKRNGGEPSHEISITHRELSLLLDGFDIFKTKPHEVLNYACVS